MAKIGQLVLAGGRWNGRQIVSDDQDYGYLWWLGRVRSNAGVVGWIGAQR